MTLQDVYDNFILSRRLADLSPKTIYDYEQFIKPFLQFIGAQRAFFSITQADLTSYLGKLLSRPLSKSTRATYIRHVKIFLRWAQKEYKAAYMAETIRVPRSPRREVRIYSDEDVKAIFDSITTETEWLTLRNKCIVALMYDSGLRQAEVCNIKLRNILLSENRMTVHGKGDKERVVPLGKLTQCYMQGYLSHCPYKSDFLFVTRRGEPLTCNAVKLMVSRISDSLPFELSSHKLRHNFATNYCIDQYDRYGQIDIYRLMYLMGHEDVETTRRYLHFAYEIISSRGCISHLDKVNLWEI